MTYLVLRLQSVGNVAMTVPILDSVRRLQPNDRFVVVAKKRLSPLFYGMSNVLFHEADWQTGGLKGWIRIYHELRRYRIDRVIDLQDNARTRVLRWLFRLRGIAVTVIDYGRAEKKAFTLFGASHHHALSTEFDRYAQTFRRAGLHVDEAFKSIEVDGEAQAYIQQQYGVKEGRWIGIAPFAKSKSNTLPFRVTKEVIGHLGQQPATRVYLFGAGKVECELLRQWASIMPNVVCVAGVLPLAQELELMRQLDVMVGMDSANQHLAALVGLRTISIWMGTHPYMGFGAWKQSPNDRIQLDIACRPCTVHGTQRCRFGNYLCQQITADKIIQKIYE